MTLAHFAVVGLGPVELWLLTMIFALGFCLAAFWIWMLVDCAKRIGAGDTNQASWLIAIAITQAIGAAAYFIFGRNKPTATLGQSRIPDNAEQERKRAAGLRSSQTHQGNAEPDWMPEILI